MTALHYGIEHAMREEPIVARIQIFDERHQIMASASAENAEQAVAQFSTPIRTELSTVDLFNSDTEPHIGDAQPPRTSARKPEPQAILRRQ